MTNFRMVYISISAFTLAITICRTCDELDAIEAEAINYLNSRKTLLNRQQRKFLRNKIHKYSDEKVRLLTDI